MNAILKWATTSPGKDILVVLSSLSGLVAIIIAVGNGIWQDRRQRKERRERRKEDAELILQEKAEAYCRVSRLLMTSMQEFCIALSLGKNDLMHEVFHRVAQEAAAVSLMEGFYFPFLREREISTGKIVRSLVPAMERLRDRIGNRSGQPLMDTVTAGAMRSDYDNLDSAIIEKTPVVLAFLDGVPQIDLYRLYSEWRRRHPT